MNQAGTTAAKKARPTSKKLSLKPMALAWAASISARKLYACGGRKCCFAVAMLDQRLVKCFRF